MRNEQRTNTHRNRGIHQGKGCFGSNNPSHMNQSRYRYNRKHDQHFATYHQNYEKYQYSWHSNNNSQNKSNASPYYDDKLESYPRVPGPGQLPSSYVSLAESTEEREKSKVSSSVYHLKQYDNGNHLAKLSILPTCKTMETLLGSSEDSSEDVSSASSFYEQNENVPDRSHEDVLSVIFPIDDNSAKPAKLREPSTYYRDLIVKMDGGSLFTMSPRSFLSGKKD
jgi:hypothetical protein